MRGMSVSISNTTRGVYTSNMEYDCVGKSRNRYRLHALDYEERGIWIHRICKGWSDWMNRRTRNQDCNLQERRKFYLWRCHQRTIKVLQQEAGRGNQLYSICAMSRPSFSSTVDRIFTIWTTLRARLFTSCGLYSGVMERDWLGGWSRDKGRFDNGKDETIG